VREEEERKEGEGRGGEKVGASEWERSSNRDG
jgi:hypothetical protein